MEDAWKAVCDDSRDLGHYWNSKDAKHDLEPTGSRKVGLFCDLVNTCKILKKWEASGFLLAGGSNGLISTNYPLEVLTTINYPDDAYCTSADDYRKSVGWLVLDV